MLFGFPVFDQFQAAHQPQAAGIADDGVLFLQFRQPVQQIAAHLRRVFHHPLPFHNFNVFQGCGGGDRMAAEGDDMTEGGFRPAHKGIGDGLAENGRAHGNIAAGNALGHGHHIRDNAPMLAGEHLAGAAEAGNHLVGNQQAAVLIAHFPQPGPVVGRRDDGSGGTGHRLGDDGRHCFRPLKADDVFDSVDALVGALFRAVAVELAAVKVGLGGVKGPGH